MSLSKEKSQLYSINMKGDWMIKKCPKCDSDKVRWNSGKSIMTCKECNHKWKRCKRDFYDGCNYR